MPVSSRHLLSQRSTLAALARAAGSAVAASLSARSAAAPVVPGPEYSAVSPPLPADLIAEYVAHVGGDAAAYVDTVPPHLFPQWTFPLAARTLEGTGYPLLRVVNGGCRLRCLRPLRAGVPLLSAARLESIDDNGRRVVMQQRIKTGPVGEEPALVADLYAIVPLARSIDAPAAKERASETPRPQAPVDALEVASWALPAAAGRDFALLTGDVNPIHWLPFYARMSGFRSVILHGFATMARTFEALVQTQAAGQVVALRELDVRFTRPLVLPARVGLYVLGHSVFVADAPGGTAYLTGTFATAPTDAD